MRGAILRWSLWAGGALIMALLLLLYTPPGLRLAGRLVGPLSGGQVHVEGLGGFFPGRLHADKIAVADKEGVWLRIDGAAIRWSALSLLANHIAVQDVSAARVTVLRRPLPATSQGGETPRIDIAHLSVPIIALGSGVTGRAVTLSASGSLHYESIHQMQADLLVARLDNGDRYRIAGGIAADVAQGQARIAEGNDGILGRLLGLPGLGPINLTAQASGDAGANNVAFQMSAGALRAQGRGMIALASRRTDIDADLSAPAMSPSADLGWQALRGEAHVHGTFAAPQIRAHLALDNGHANGLAAQTLTLDVQGNDGRLALNGVAERLTAPGDYGGLLAQAPVHIQMQAALNDPTRPVKFAIAHPLVQLEGTARTKGPLALDAKLTLPNLTPLAAAANTPLAGHAAFTLKFQQENMQVQVALDGRMRLAGDTLPARLLGDSSLTMTATARKTDLTASHVRLQGAGLTVDATGTVLSGRLNYSLALELNDLSKLAKTIQGTLALKGSATGPIHDASFTVGGAAVLATQGFARQRVSIGVKAEGLPAAKSASLTLDGRLNNAPLAMQATLTGTKTRQAKLTAHWRSWAADAAVAIGGDSNLSGTVRMAVRNLSDITPFVGTPLQGAADMAASLRPRSDKTDATVTAHLSNLKSSGISVATVTLSGSAADILGKPQLNVTGHVQQASAQGWTGDSDLSVQGPRTALAVALQARLTDPQNAPLNVQASANADLDRKQVTLTKLDAHWRDLPLMLDGPTTVQFGDKLAIENLSAHLGKGRITAAGTLSPQLALNASVSNIALADLRPLLPGIDAQGTLSADAVLHGSLAAPTGRISIKGQELRTAFTPGNTAASIAMVAQLAGDHATIEASADAGQNVHMTVNGTAPLNAQGTMALHGQGHVDLALLDAVLAASGRRLRGTLTLDGAVAGTLAAPRITGHAEMAGGEFQDYAQGMRIRDITATITSDGTHVTLTQASAHAGTGTLSASGNVDLAAPDMPVTMRLQASEARPIASDLITASISGDASLSGHVKGVMTLAGKLQVTGGDINLPDSFPPEIAVLNVRRRGQPAPPPPPRQLPIQLDLAVRTTGPIFVRGHGMDAEMGGAIQIAGTSGAPQISGGLRMNRGTFTVAGQTLDFTSGRVRFDGTGVRGRLDPSLDFVAQTVSGGVTATLTITGYASAPKIVLSSTPPLPQDEIVAHLLFQQSVRQLSPLQVASIAQAAAAMGGIGGGFNPLGTVRKTLGLDRLSVGSVQGGATGTQSQTTVEAGRYVSRGVYVGVKQNLSGGTQTQVQVDITRRLKAQATLSTGTTTATAQGNALQDNGSSVGLSYQFDY